MKCQTGSGSTVQKATLEKNSNLVGKKSTSWEKEYKFALGTSIRNKILLPSDKQQQRWLCGQTSVLSPILKYQISVGHIH